MARFYPTDSGCVLAVYYDDSVLDQTINANDGTLVGSPSYDADGVVDKSILLNGSSQYVKFGNDSSFDFTSGLTISAWVKKPSFTPTNTIISKRSAYSSTGIPFELAVDGTNIQFRVKGNTSVVTCAHGMSINTWYHIAATWDGTTAKVFVNNVEKGSSSIGGSITTNTAVVTNGALPGGGEKFNGRIDRLFVFSSSKESQISDEYNLVAASNGAHVFGDDMLVY